MRALVFSCAVALIAPACEGDPAQKAKQAAETAKQGAAKAAEKTKQAAEAVADKATDVTQDAVAVLKPHADKVKGSIESVIVETTTTATGAAKVATLAAEAVDRDTTILPIYQEIGDEAAQAEIDEAIADMPRTEVVDGVTVGFKDMVDMDGADRSSESGYLVVWRKGDKLIGFVYRSKMKIDFSKLADVVGAVDSGL